MRRNNWLGFVGGMLASVVITVGCTRSSEASIDKVDTRNTAAKTIGTQVSGDPADAEAYSASMSGAGECKVNEECKIALRLKTKEPFHINKEYPTKFNGSGGEGYEFVGGPSYRFTPSQEKEETFTVTIKRTSGGAITPKGVFKFGVCKDSGCQVAAVDLSTTLS